MKTSELKKLVVQKIAKIDDVAFLEAIHTIIEIKIHSVSNSQNNIINSSNIEHDDSENDDLKWLYDR